MDAAVKNLIAYLLNRAKETSTWRSVVYFITGTFGFTLTDDVATATIATGVALAGLIGTIFADKLGKDAEKK